MQQNNKSLLSYVFLVILIITFIITKSTCM